MRYFGISITLLVMTLTGAASALLMSLPVSTAGAAQAATATPAPVMSPAAGMVTATVAGPMIMGSAVTTTTTTMPSMMGMPTASQTPTATLGQKMPVIIGYYTEISPAELKDMLAKKDFPLINVHTPYAGEIPETDAFIVYNQIATDPKLPQDKSAKLVLYCSSGHMGRIAAETLVKLGYTNVFNLAGGMKAWQAVQYPLLNNPK